MNNKIIGNIMRIVVTFGLLVFLIIEDLLLAIVFAGGYLLAMFLWVMGENK